MLADNGFMLDKYPVLPKAADPIVQDKVIVETDLSFGLW